MADKKTLEYWFEGPLHDRRAYVRSSEHDAIICAGRCLDEALQNIVKVLSGMIMEEPVTLSKPQDK